MVALAAAVSARGDSGSSPEVPWRWRDEETALKAVFASIGSARVRASAKRVHT
jgi:hypothetical protein